MGIGSFLKRVFGGSGKVDTSPTEYIPRAKNTSRTKEATKAIMDVTVGPKSVTGGPKRKKMVAGTGRPNKKKKKVPVSATRRKPPGSGPKHGTGRKRTRSGGGGRRHGAGRSSIRHGRGFGIDDDFLDDDLDFEDVLESDLGSGGNDSPSDSGWSSSSDTSWGSGSSDSSYSSGGGGYDGGGGCDSGGCD